MDRKRLSLLLAKFLSSTMSNRLSNPVFIIGCARSGKTLLAKLISAHPRMAYWAEANDIWDPNGYPWNRSTLETPPVWADPAAFTARWWRDTEPRRREIRAIFGAYEWLNRTSHFLNDSALNTFRIPYLVSIFPEARFIHMVRDGRAVAHTYAVKMHAKIQDSPLPYQSVGLNHSYDELVVQLGVFWKANLEEVAKQDVELRLGSNNSLLELSYEDLCADPISARNLAGTYLGLELTGLADPSENGQLENQNHWWRQSLGDNLIVRLEAAVNPMLSQKGYLGATSQS